MGTHGSKKKHSQQPRFGAKPTGEHSPKIGVDPERFNSFRISWHFGSVDHKGPWSPTRIGVSGLEEAVAKLRDFESRTWNEILGSQSHAVEVTKLARTAQKRLQKIELDDAAYLISLRLTGKCRLWGIRDDAVLRVLWWDPEHEVCPSLKKNT